MTGHPLFKGRYGYRVIPPPGQPPTRPKKAQYGQGRPNPLGIELFALVQTDQGRAFVSDAVEETTDDNVIRMAEIALFHGERCTRKLRKFLKKHDALRR